MKFESLPSPRNLSRYVETDVDDVRATLLWDSVSARVRRTTRRRLGWRVPAVVFVGAAAAAIALLATRRTNETRQAVEYDKNGSMTFADGSHIRLRDGLGAASAGRVRLEHADARGIEVTLAEGAAEFDVVHVAGRSFVVHAGRVDVVDIGTRFVVARDGESTSVSVESGRVEVRDVTGALPARTIAAGESWSSAAAVPSATEAAVLELPDAHVAPAVVSAAPHVPTAKELLEAADAARVAGRSRDAAALLDMLRRRHRGDPRAGLAAFELGRLRLDALGDAPGAVEAFDDTIALAPNASFREDAEARRIEALERARDPRCREARETYVARYPKGLHVVEVAARCNP